MQWEIIRFSVDFSSAFDRCNRVKHLFINSPLWVFLSILETLDHNTFSSFGTTDGFFKKFEIKFGFKRCCLISPLLFWLYLNDHYYSIDIGIQLCSVTRKLLAYCDVILFCGIMQVILRNIKKKNVWAKYSKIMIF